MTNTAYNYNEALEEVEDEFNAAHENSEEE